MADSVEAAATPASVMLEPFSVELIFASGDDFQDEILRLFLAAGLIILLVLSIVFLVRPRTVRDRALFVARHRSDGPWGRQSPLPRAWR